MHLVRILQRDQMAVVLGHGQTQLGHRLDPVGKQPLLEGCICPRFSHNACAVLRQPALFDQMIGLLYKCCRLHAALMQHGLNGINALGNGSGWLLTV